MGGRVLVIEERSCAETSRLWDAVRDEGYELVTMPLGRTIEQAATVQRPDVVLLNMIAAEHGAERNRYLDAASRLVVATRARRLPVIGIGESADHGRPIGMADVIPRPLSAGRLLGRIAALSRLATIQTELRRRMETGERFGVDCPGLDYGYVDHDANILVIGNGGRYLAIEAALSRMATLTGAFTATTARDYLGRRNFDLVLLDMPLAEAIELVADLRRNPAWFCLPMIGFGGGEAIDLIEQAHREAITDLVIGPVEPLDLVERTRSAIAESRVRERMKAVYAQARHLATNDALTGLYGRGYLMEHLSQLVREARRFGERFALIALTIPQMAAINRKFGYSGGDHLIRQIGIMISRLARGEDLAAHIGGGRFAVVLPTSGYDDAAAASTRIAAVIRATRFVIPHGDEPLTVALDLGHAIWTASDDAESLLARVLGQQVR